MTRQDIQAFGDCKRSEGDPCDPCRQSIEIAAQITKARVTLDTLLQQQTQLYTEINSNHEPFIHRLPPEISSYIFELSLPKDWHTLEERRKLGRTEVAAPLVLGAVCHTWRRIAWSSRLWTRISFVYDMSIIDSNLTLLETAAEWLSRAGQYPLSISIYQRTVAPRPDQRAGVIHALMPFVTLMNMYSHRWLHLDIQCPNELLPHFSGNAKGPPILDKLRIVDDYRDEFQMDEFFMGELMPAPSFVETSFMPLKIDWSNVTTMDSEHLTHDELLEVLRTASRLRNCDVYDIMYTGDLDSNTPFVHNTLQSHNLNQMDPLASAPLFDVPSLPALKNLTLEIYLDILPFSTLSNLAINSGTCLLSSLFLDGSVMNDGQLIEFLQHTPLLVDLHVQTERDPEDVEAMSDLVQYLGRTSSTLADSDRANARKKFLPILRSLKISTSGAVTNSHIPWTDVVELFGPIADLGKAGTRPLTSGYIFYYGEILDDEPSMVESIDQNDVARFMEIVQKGITLKLIFYGGQDILKLSIERLDMEPLLIAGDDA